MSNTSKDYSKKENWNNIRRVRIEVGEHAGEIHEGFGIGYRTHPDVYEPGKVNQDHIWIPALNKAFPASCWGELSPNDKHSHVFDLNVPFDKFKREIFAGDTLLVAYDKQVSRVKVLKLGKVHHHGCGWCERVLHVQDLDGEQKKFVVRNPLSTVKYVSLEVE